MTRTVAIVCGAGVSSTFLARAVRDLVRERGLDWTVEALAEDQLVDRASSLDLVLANLHEHLALHLVVGVAGVGCSASTSPHDSTSCAQQWARCPSGCSRTPNT